MQHASVSSGARADTSLWDRMGIGLSGLCAVHCLLTSVVLAVLPLWSVAFEVDAWVHPVFAALLVPTTLLALRRAVRHGHPKAVAVLLGVGLLIILSALAVGHVGEAGAWGEAVVTLVGSSLLITGHWRNWRGCPHDADEAVESDASPEAVLDLSQQASEMRSQVDFATIFEARRGTTGRENGVEAAARSLAQP